MERTCRCQLEIHRFGWSNWASFYEGLTKAADRLAPGRHVMWTPPDPPDRLAIGFFEYADCEAFERWLMDYVADKDDVELYEAVVDVPEAIAGDVDRVVALREIARSITLNRYQMTGEGVQLAFGFAETLDAESFRRRLEEITLCAADTPTH
ncbi:hypothetical protein FHP25_25080 [Vineibacter terrae]|uniref:Uncharacterized protein n=1 Tax=Vineibacter terrae TaxID=2586908 RepID=A0A5C8PFL5_9HYPH|nr:hypothetical protein [Vineibacter terrae]TXL72573.1 hypothetical protein FHP25_25080 [Vineibacter terrae]